MSGITIKINKGESNQFKQIMSLVQCFENVKECKHHYAVNISEEEMVIHQDQISDVLKQLPLLREKEMFSIPNYGTNEWYDWIIDLHLSKKKAFKREGDF